jgi:hypothetical protein
LTGSEAVEKALFRRLSEALTWYVQVPSPSLEPDGNEKELVLRVPAPETSE